MANRYKLHAVTLNDGSSKLVQGIKSQTYSPNVEALIEGHSGRYEPLFGAVMNVKPMISFTTTDIATIVGITGMFYKKLNSALLYFQKVDCMGTRAAGSTHIELELGVTLAVVRRISVSNGAIIEAEIELYPGSTDGLTSPVTVTNNKALTGAVTAVDYFTCGPAELDEYVVPVLDWSYDSGVNVVHDTHSGLVYPDCIFVDTVTPEVTLNSPSIGSLIPFPECGSGLETCVLYGRRMSKECGRSSDNDNFALTLNDALVYTESANAAHEGTGSSSLKLNGLVDSIGDPSVSVAFDAEVPDLTSGY